MGDIEVSPPAECEVRKVAIHEAAHAVLHWNFGFGVQYVFVDRVRCCGHVQPSHHARGRLPRISRAIGRVAGLAAHSFVEEKLTWEDVWRAHVDLENALADFLPLGDHTDGERLGVAVALVRRVALLLHTPEIKKQIDVLVTPLLAQGRLFQTQVHSRLNSLPETPAARKTCRSFALALEKDREQIVRKAAGYAPEFRWQEAFE